MKKIHNNLEKSKCSSNSSKEEFGGVMERRGITEQIPKSTEEFEEVDIDSQSIFSASSSSCSVITHYHMTSSEYETHMWKHMLYDMVMKKKIVTEKIINMMYKTEAELKKLNEELVILNNVIDHIREIL